MLGLPAALAAALLMSAIVFVPAGGAAGSVTVTPNTGLVNGQAVTVSWTGLRSNFSPVIEQCTAAPANPATDCDFLTLVVSDSNGAGAGTDTFNVFAGASPSNLFTCDDLHPCTIRVADDPNDIATGSVATVAFAPIPVGPKVSVGDATVVEGDGGNVNLSFPVRLSETSASPVTVVYSTANGTAQTAAPADYTAKAAQTLTIPATKTGGNIAISVKGDGRAEPSETFTVSLSSPTGASLGRATATGTILDNDAAATPLVSVGDVKVVEGNTSTSKATFDVTLDQASASAVTVPWSTTAGTATATTDYTSASGTLTFPAGATSKTASVVVKGDASVEANETVLVNLGVPVNAAVGDGSGLLTILDDDTTPSATALSIGDVALTEGDTLNHNASFTVRLAQPAAGTVSVNYTTAPGTATATADYTAKTGTLTIAQGAVTGTVAVPVVAEALHEVNESFTVALSSPTGGATLGRTTGTATIVDDDPASSVVGIGEATTVEGNAGTATVLIPVTLTQPSATPVTVVVNSAFGSATALDFTAIVNKTITIPAGATSANISVVIKADTAVEGSETFTLVLSGPTGASIGRAIGTFTILDDD